jgi:hypothetical protein
MWREQIIIRTSFLLSYTTVQLYVAANPTPPSPTLVNPPTAENAIFALQSADGTYLVGWDNGGVSLEQSVQDWARWTKVHTGGGKVALRSLHGTYLSARDRGWIVLTAYSHQGWEEWTEVKCRIQTAVCLYFRTVEPIFPSFMAMSGSPVTIWPRNTGADCDDESYQMCV